MPAFQQCNLLSLLIESSGMFGVEGVRNTANSPERLGCCIASCASTAGSPSHTPAGFPVPACNTRTAQRTKIHARPDPEAASQAHSCETPKKENRVNTHEASQALQTFKTPKIRALSSRQVLIPPLPRSGEFLPIQPGFLPQEATTLSWFKLAF